MHGIAKQNLPEPADRGRRSRWHRGHRPGELLIEAGDCVILRDLGGKRGIEGLDADNAGATRVG